MGGLAQEEDLDQVQEVASKHENEIEGPHVEVSVEPVYSARSEVNEEAKTVKETPRKTKVNASEVNFKPLPPKHTPALRDNIVLLDLNDLSYKNITLRHLLEMGISQQRTDQNPRSSQMPIPAMSDTTGEKRQQEERVVLISQVNKQQLLALFNAFGINTLMLLDMEISQKVCKIVPYTSAAANNQYFTSSDSDSQNDDDETVHTKPSRNGKHKIESLFYNLTHRDKTSWSKVHV